MKVSFEVSKYEILFMEYWFVVISSDWLFEEEVKIL